MEGSEIDHSVSKVLNHKPINDLDIDTNLESEENSEEASPLPETMKYYSSSAGQNLSRSRSTEEEAHDAEKRKHFQRLGSATFVGNSHPTSPPSESVGGPQTGGRGLLLQRRRTYGASTPASSATPATAAGVLHTSTSSGAINSTAKTAHSPMVSVPTCALAEPATPAGAVRPQSLPSSAAGTPAGRRSVVASLFPSTDAPIEVEEVLQTEQQTNTAASVSSVDDAPVATEGNSCLVIANTDPVYTNTNIGASIPHVGHNSPDPVHSSHSSLDPVHSNPDPVHSNPDPVHPGPGPVQPDHSAVHSSPGPVHKNPDPVPIHSNPPAAPETRSVAACSPAASATSSNNNNNNKTSVGIPSCNSKTNSSSNSSKPLLPKAMPTGSYLTKPSPGSSVCSPSTVPANAHSDGAEGSHAEKAKAMVAVGSVRDRIRALEQRSSPVSSK